MSDSNSQSVITINLPLAAVRWLLLVSIAALAICYSIYSFRWYIGDVVAEYAPGVEAGGLDMARLAIRWGPNDPFTHRRLAMLEEENFSAANLASAVHEWEVAVSLSPNDYRYWMALGRSFDANGEPVRAQMALRRAVELAPAYSQPRWYLGNSLLREGKLEDAFAQFKVAADNDEEMRPQVFSLAWSAFDKDIDRIIKLLGSSSAETVQFASYLINIDAIDAALKVWESVPLNDRRAQHETAEKLEQTLLDKKQFRGALSIMRSVATDPAKLPIAEQVWNGGFEDERSTTILKPFGWTINSRPQIQLSIEKLGHTGDNSLQIIFKGPNKLDPIQASQTVAVEPSAGYRLECFARTQSLVSAGTMVITIIDASDNTVLASSSPLPKGSNDWQRITVDFQTKPKSDGIIVGFSRASCESSELCAIFGTAWYDDFNLQRISARDSSTK